MASDRSLMRRLYSMREAARMGAANGLAASLPPVNEH
jgi:hypothetical protein